MSLEGKQLGRYRLLRLLGSGGMGEVYLAEDARIAQQVAIKVIRSEVTPYPDSSSATEAARLFEREAKAITRLDHPNILPLYTYGEEHVDGLLLSYLVMPYRKEGTLATWLRQRGTAELLSPQDVAHLLKQAADALQHAHDQQVLHQDIKPSNFLIRSRKDRPNQPDLLLADFGIAKFTGATATASQSIRGTPTYMAPEQWDGRSIPATDQYALAIMAYELLTGRPPFQGRLEQVMRQHYYAQPAPPSTFNPRLSPALDAVILRALAKSPQERFASAAAFATAFQQAVTSVSLHGLAGPPPTFYGPPFPAMAMGTGSHPPEPGSRQSESTLRASNPNLTVPGSPPNFQEATTLTSSANASTSVDFTTGGGNDKIISPKQGLSRGKVIVLVTVVLLVVVGSAALLTTAVTSQSVNNSSVPAQANATAQASVQSTVTAAQPIATATSTTIPSNQNGSIFGTWNSDYGPVTLEGSDQHITGFWVQAPDKRGIIESGTFDPSTGKLMFYYYQNWNNQSGVAELTLSADGKQLQGTWSQGNGSGTWTLTRS